MFTPENATTSGKSRCFTRRDAVRAAAMSHVINRCGLPVPVGAAIAEKMGARGSRLIADFSSGLSPIFAAVWPESIARTKGAIAYARGWEVLADRLDRSRYPAAIVVNISAIALKTIHSLAEQFEE